MRLEQQPGTIDLGLPLRLTGYGGVDSRLALALYALAGGVALGYEVLWTQAVVQFLSTRAMAFSVVLATYLIGLVAGSWIFARFADRVRWRWTAFGALVAAAGLAAMASSRVRGVRAGAAAMSLIFMGSFFLRCL